jgi:hypothetical protein
MHPVRPNFLPRAWPRPRPTEQGTDKITGGPDGCAMCDRQSVLRVALFGPGHPRREEGKKEGFCHHRWPFPFALPFFFLVGFRALVFAAVTLTQSLSLPLTLWAAQSRCCRCRPSVGSGAARLGRKTEQNGGLFKNCAVQATERLMKCDSPIACRDGSSCPANDRRGPNNGDEGGGGGEHSKCDSRIRSTGRDPDDRKGVIYSSLVVVNENV